MLSNLHNRAPLHCLGDLLVASGALTPIALRDVVTIARRMNAPIGRALVATGMATESDVEAALNAQRAIRDGSVSETLAKELLRVAHSYQVSIDEAYMLNSIRFDNGLLTRLAKLVLAAGIVNEGQLRNAMNYSERTALPIGHALVHLEYLSEAALATCFNLQILIRDGHLSFFDAVRALRFIENDGETFEMLLEALGMASDDSVPKPRVGEILVAANLISHEENLMLAEIGIERDTQYGLLVSVVFDLLPTYVVKAAVQLQRMFCNPTFTLEQAARILTMVVKTETDLENVLEQLDSIKQAVRLMQSTSVSREQSVIIEDGDLETSPYNDYEISIAEAMLIEHTTHIGQLEEAIFVVNSLRHQNSDAGTVSEIGSRTANEAQPSAKQVAA